MLLHRTFPPEFPLFFHRISPPEPFSTGVFSFSNETDVSESMKSEPIISQTENLYDEIESELKGELNKYPVNMSQLSN